MSSDKKRVAVAAHEVGHAGQSELHGQVVEEPVRPAADVGQEEMPLAVEGDTFLDQHRHDFA